jgi:hypothetical protein
MATVYLEFENVEQKTYTSQFVNTGNIIDGVDNTFSTCEAVNISGYDIWIWVNTISNISRTDYITKVEVCLTGYSIGEFDESVILRATDLRDDTIYIDSTIPLQSTNTSVYTDITDSGSFPGYGNWLWDDIENLDVSLKCIMSGYIGSETTFYIDSIRLRITTQDNPIPIYGLRCKDSLGNITLEPKDSISRVLYSETYSYNSSPGYIEITVDNYTRTMGFSNPLEQDKIPHSLRLYSSTIDGNNRIEQWELVPQSLSISGHTLQASRSKIIIIGY